MHCLRFPNKPCDLLTCHTKRRCLWTAEECPNLSPLLTPFDVLDALRGDISGEYEEDLKRLNKAGKTCTRKLYEEAYQQSSQP